MNKKRQDLIYEEILAKSTCKVSDLADLFHVSSETIRKDLNHLESLGLISKNHGSATILNDYLQLPADVKMNEHPIEKEWIARKAIELIKDNSVIYLDPSTICVKLTRYLPLKKNCTIVTNSLAIAQTVLHTNHDLLFLGGHVIKKSSASIGAYANEMIDTLQIDYAFQGTDGFLGLEGPSTFSKEEFEIKRHIIEKSKTNILICDHSKFDKSATYQYAKFTDFDILISNNISDKEKAAFKNILKIIDVKTNN